MRQVNAVLVDENTLEVNGVTFIRKSHDEVLLQPTTKGQAPRLKCGNCNFERGYTFWYRHIGFEGRQIAHCPGCGLKIMGVVGNAIS